MCQAALEYAMENFDGMKYCKGGDGKKSKGIGSCHLVYEGLTNAGIDIPFFSHDDWKSPVPTKYGFSKVSAPQKGDVVVFGGHVAFYVHDNMIYTSSIRGGVCEVDKCWFGKIECIYRYIPTEYD